MQDMRQLESMGLMDPEQVEKFREAIDNATPGEETEAIKRLIDPVKDEAGLRRIARSLNREFSNLKNTTGHTPKHMKPPLPKNKVKRERAKTFG